MAAAAGAARAEAPGRVVSLNLCTDQLAMMLSAPGQLAAVSAIARDPRMSAMVEQARAHPVVHGGAEEVYLMRPDLVLAGTHTTRHTISMLQRLGVRVEEFAPATTFDDVRDNIRRLGGLLGREKAAERMLKAFDARLARLRAETGRRPRAALYYANSYSAGARTLAGRILAVAGFANVAGEAGLNTGGTLPLEQLIMLAPELVVTGTRYPGASRAEAVLDHPALRAFRDGRATTPLADADWVCGTPHLLEAVAELRAAREALQ